MSKVSCFPGFVCLFLMGGCNKEPPVAKFSELQPAVKFSELTYEGVPKAGVFRHRFEVRNEGTAFLEIRDATPGCGCTLAAVGDTVIDPGGTSYIEATMQVTRQRRMSRIYVQTNDPARPEVTLTLQVRGPFPNEFVFLPASRQVTVKRDEPAILNCLLSFTAWKENGPITDDFPQPEIVSEVEDVELAIEPGPVKDAADLFWSTRPTTNEHGWVKGVFSDRTLWVWPVRLVIRPQKPGVKLAMISAKKKGRQPPNEAILLLTVDNR